MTKTLLVRMVIPICTKPIVPVSSLTFSKWLPVKEKDFLCIGKGNMKLTFWFEPSSAGRSSAKELSSWTNVTPHSINADVLIAGIPNALVDYIIKYDVTALIGVPSFIIRLTEFIDTLPEKERENVHIKKIFHAGEFLSIQQAKFIKEKLNCQINPFIYSSTDTGTIGMKCPNSKTNQYHIADSIYLETIDIDTSKPVPIGVSGEFVVTSLVNEKAPCIRYRVGDMGRIDDYSCTCGNKAPLFTLKGRADDEVKIAGYFINPDIIQQGLSHFPEISRNFQLIVEEVDQKSKLTIVCEMVPNSSIERSSELPEKIAIKIAEEYDILGVLIEQEYCLPLKINLVPAGKLPRNPRTGKIKRVRNLR